jgi:hypothetical protein
LRKQESKEVDFFAWAIDKEVFFNDKPDWSQVFVLLGYGDGTETTMVKGKNPRRTRLYQGSGSGAGKPPPYGL